MPTDIPCHTVWYSAFTTIICWCSYQSIRTLTHPQATPPPSVDSIGRRLQYITPPQAEDQHSFDAAPQQHRWCTNGQKTMPLRRRRISSPIYAAARHYRHRLTCKDLPERCLAGYDAIGPQLEAYEGHRWPSFSRRRGGLPSSCVLCGEAASQLELLYVARPTFQDDQVDKLGDLSPNITKGRMHFHANISTPS